MHFSVNSVSDWLKLIGGLITVVGSFYAFIKWAPGAVDALEKRRITKKQTAESLAKFVAKLPEFMEQMTQAFETIGLYGDRLQSIERHQAQQTVMMHSIIETLPEAVVWTDGEGEPTAVSRGFTSMTGCDLSAMRDGGWQRMVHPDDLDGVLAAWDVARTRKQVFHRTYQIRNVQDKHHSWFEIECLSIPMTNKAGWKATFVRTADAITHSPVPMATNTPIIPGN